MRYRPTDLRLLACNSRQTTSRLLFLYFGILPSMQQWIDSHSFISGSKDLFNDRCSRLHPFACRHQTHYFVCFTDNKSIASIMVRIIDPTEPIRQGLSSGLTAWGGQTKIQYGRGFDNCAFERIFHSLICAGWNRLVKNGLCATLSNAYALTGINKQVLNRNEC